MPLPRCHAWVSPALPAWVHASAGMPRMGKRVVEQVAPSSMPRTSCSRLSTEVVEDSSAISRLACAAVGLGLGWERKGWGAGPGSGWSGAAAAAPAGESGEGGGVGEGRGGRVGPEREEGDWGGEGAMGQRGEGAQEKAGRGRYKVGAAGARQGYRATGARSRACLVGPTCTQPYLVGTTCTEPCDAFAPLAVVRCSGA